MNPPLSSRSNASRASLAVRDSVSRNGMVRDERSCISEIIWQLGSTHWNSSNGLFVSIVVLGGGRLGFDKPDTGLRSVDPDEFAAPERQPGRRQQQEKFAGPQHVDRPFNIELGARCGDVEEKAASPPGAIDAHQVDGVSVLEPNARGPAAFPSHRPALARARPLSIASGFA